MNIWAFPSFYPFDRPGITYAGIFAHRQYKGLVENGANVKVIVPVVWTPPFPVSLLHPEWKKYQALAYPYERVYDGIKVYHPRIANMRPNRFVKKSYEERYVDAIVNFFRRNKIVLNPETDIFYSQWLPASLLVQRAANILGAPSAILSIGDDVVLWPASSPQNHKLFEETLTGASYRFACADYLGKLANSILGKDLPYEVVRMGAEYDFFKPATVTEKETLRKHYNISPNKIVILCIGTASKRKGWIDLFDALVEIKKHAAPNFLLVGVHTGAEEFDFAAETAQRGLQQQFLDLGEVAPQALNKIYNLADIFCLPSHSEGIANVVIEAMSCGLPVITTHVCGHPELVTDGVDGLLIPPQEPAPLLEKLLLLLNDENVRRRLGAAAREHIVNVWGNYADNAKRLYQILSAGKT